MVVIPSIPGRKNYEERNKKDVASSGYWNQSVDSMNKNLDSIIEGSDSINESLDSMNEGLDSMNEGLDSVNEGLDSVNKSLDSLNEELDSFLNVLREINSHSNLDSKNVTDFKESEESKEAVKKI